VTGRLGTAARVAGFVVAIVAVFGLAAVVGRAVGPAPAEEPTGHDMARGGPEGHGAVGHGEHAQAATPAGLTASSAGYTLALAADRARPGRAVPLAFTITGPDGHPVTDYDVQHEKRLHLVVVRRDGTGFQHVHPELAVDGTWSTTVDLTPGAWRVYADSRPSAAEPVVLGADLLVPGDFQPVAPRPDSRTDTVDGYTVTLDGDLTAGADAVLTPRVVLDGRDVTGELEPYLGALGHLVALRRADLAYLHVHPDGLAFHTSVPSAGAYELFLDFQHGGVVRTVHLTLTATEGHVHD
jgi:hypothetical protein